MKNLITVPLDGSTFSEQALPYAAELARSMDAERSHGVQVETAVVVHSGSSSGIIEFTVNNDVDLIAMSTHARHGWARATLGSVGDEIMRNSNVPLMLLREKDQMELTEADLLADMILL